MIYEKLDCVSLSKSDKQLIMEFNRNRINKIEED